MKSNIFLILSGPVTGDLSDNKQKDQMTFRITIFSQEVEDFVMEARIDAEAKFTELHNLIISTCNYQDMNNSVKRLSELDVKNIYPGLGPIVENNGKDHIKLSYSFL